MMFQWLLSHVQCTQKTISGKSVTKHDIIMLPRNLGHYLLRTDITTCVVHGCLCGWLAMCVCACLHVCMHVPVCEWTHMCGPWMSVWVAGCMCMCVSACLCVCVPMCEWTCIRAGPCMTPSE